MPLPLRRLYGIGTWLEENAADVIHESVASGVQTPNPLSLVARILMRVNVSEMAYQVFSIPKDPDTGEHVNKGLTVEFFDEYLDVPTAQNLFNTFIELNEIENVIKNLQSLPVTRKLMEVSSYAFGIPFLNSLQQNTVSPQSKLEGSQSPRSMDSSQHVTSGGQANGKESESKSPTANRVM
jgi:hypothetical protein